MACLETKTTDHACLAGRWTHVCIWLSLTLSTAWAQPVRVVDPLDVSKTKLLTGSRTQKAHAQYDRGPVDPSQRISGVTLVLKPSASQVNELKRLLQEQQNPSSPNFHRWLTPDQYADRFGVSPEDLGKVRSWLEAVGLRVDYVARGRTWIMCSGSAGQVQTAFHTELHRYNAGGEWKFANATDPSVPAAFEPVVMLVRGLDDFRAMPTPAKPRRMAAKPVAEFTSGPNHSLVPGDIATIYDMNPLYQSGWNGTGQTIAVAGQTDIYPSDIAYFRNEFGLPVNYPEIVLVPGSDDPGIDANDIFEATLDVEYAGGAAPGASIVFVTSTDVWTSVAYAVDQDLAPVLSVSYGFCEPQISSEPASPAAYFQSLAQTANSMGITWISGSGDWGAADCDVASGGIATQGLAVSLPASIPEVTGVGGTEFSEATGQYWGLVNNSNRSSALSYIPEVAWNDTASVSVLQATGGGASIFFPKPAWQNGPGVPNDDARHVPDVAFTASATHDPFQIYAEGQGWYIGGTSAAAPIFAGMIAVLNQYLVSNGIQSQPGLGNVNPQLYLLAQTKPQIFHDITAGNNVVPCASGSPNCTNGQLGYQAGVGYDQTTGLGSLDANNLVTFWNASQPVATTTAVTANHTSISSNSSTTLTATVSAVSGTVAPTGSVTFSIGQTVLGTVALSGSSAVSTASLSVNGTQLASGANTITVTYAGDAAFTWSAAALSITVSLTVASVSVTPNAGSGMSQTFALQYSDMAGASSLQEVWVWFTVSTASSVSSCVLYYAPVANQVALYANDGATPLTAAPGAATTLQNSQCSLNVAGVTVSQSGNNLTLTVPMTFQTSYAGAKNIYLYAADVSGANTGWVRETTWTVPSSGSGTPLVVSVTPGNGTGLTQSFTLQYSDTAGASELQKVWAWFTVSTASSVSSCVLYYAPVANQVALYANDGATPLTAAPGAATTLQNSQCSLNVAGVTVSQSGNNLTLTVPMTFPDHAMRAPRTSTCTRRMFRGAPTQVGCGKLRGPCRRRDPGRRWWYR